SRCLAPHSRRNSDGHGNLRHQFAENPRDARCDGGVPRRGLVGVRALAQRAMRARREAAAARRRRPMSDFTSDFWHFYIAAVSLASIVACGVFLKLQSVTANPKDTTGHTWDEDLTEYDNPLPRWWAWLFYLTIAFSLGYLVLYPGLGSYKGTLGWTQLGQLEDENKVANAEFGPLYDKFAKLPVETLAKSGEAIAVGQKLFLNYCSQCHASDGGGSRGFPKLTDKDWLWGGTQEHHK